MRNLTRRHALLVAAAIPAVALAGCAMTGSNGVAITQAVLTDAQNIIAGLHLLQGTTGSPLIPDATLSQIATYVGDAQTVLAKIASAVGGTISGITAQGLVNDLEAASSAIAPFFGGNPYLLDVQVLLPIVAAALGVLLPAAVKRNAMDPGEARARLGALPRPTPIN